ncbi:hypothetical protein QEZ52_13100 [Aliisedimentitalea scapharcae]|uniref:Uncharacterized protein n=1 Tax=Aliisedimentitalea scapharcae TaxID=1524259 RepID=A0ABZ2XN90_9RHOB
MKAMLTSFAAIVLIAIAANFGLERAGFSAQDVHSGTAVRLD